MAPAIRFSKSTLLLALAGILALATAHAVATDLAALHRRARGPAAADRPGEGAGREARPGAGDSGPGDAGRGGASVESSPVPGAAPAPRRVPALGPGLRIVRVAVDPPWRLPTGSVVDVLAPAEGIGPADVVAAGAVVLDDAQHTADRRRQEHRPAAPKLSYPASVTLLVTVDAARRLATASAAGPLRLALAPPEAACCRTSSSGSSRD